MMRAALPRSAKLQASQAWAARRLPWTTNNCAATTSSDACFALEKEASRQDLVSLANLVPSGRDLCAAGDARIRGKEQPAGSRASCRPLLSFVRLGSERTIEAVR
jgi:hypothetical protein